MQINAAYNKARFPILLRSVLAAGVLSVLCIIVALVFAMQIFRGSSYIEGTVLDSSTLKPLEGVAVAVSNRGWGFVDGQLVWDKDYIYQALSERNGRFRIEFSIGSSAHVKATKQGYQPYDNWYEPNSTVTIRLKNINPSYRPLPYGILDLVLPCTIPRSSAGSSGENRRRSITRKPNSFQVSPANPKDWDSISLFRLQGESHYVHWESRGAWRSLYLC